MKRRNANGAWDETVDVVVIGSGFAGLVGALEAAKNNSAVLVLEKMAYSGGNSRVAGGGYCCWDSELKLREKLGLGDDSWESHYRDTLAAGGGYANPKLVEVMAKEAPAGLNLLADVGIPFRDSLPRPGGHSAYRSYQIACTGSETIEKLETACLQTGRVELRRSCRVTGILRDDGGPVRGVSVVVDGKELNIHATSGVIIASGGFSQDVGMRMAYRPTLSDAYSCTNHKGATGEVIRFAREIGADVVQMEFIQLYPCADPTTGMIDQGAFLCYSGTGYGLIYVDALGSRFVNELETREIVSEAQLASGSKPTYSILSEKIFRKLGIGEEDVSALVRRGRAVESETLEGLAKAAGFNERTFLSAVHEHNEAIENGVDTCFGKPMTKHMVSLTEGPFYAIAQWPSIHYCMGGLRADEKARVVDIWGNPIPRLYAAGEVCGGLHGIDRLAGNGIAECVVFGRIAGQLA